MSESPDIKGRVSEGIILSEFLKRGLVVSVPFGYSQRYDLVVEISGALYKVQIKTGRIRNGAVAFNTCSLNNVTHERRHYRGQVDFIAVYEPVSQKIYLVPPDSVGKVEGFLRFRMPNTGQKSRISLAEDFILDKVLESLGK